MANVHTISHQGLLPSREAGSHALPDKKRGEVSYDITAKDKRIIQLVSAAFTNQQIAEQFGLSREVVKNYLRLIYDKTGMSTRLELAMWALAHPEKLQ